MGLHGSKSKTEIDSLQKTIADIAESSVQSCVVSAAEDQKLDIVNSGFSLWGNYDLAQSTTIDSTCFGNLNRQTQLQDGIFDAIAQRSTSDGIALLGAFGSSESSAAANLRSIIRNNVTLSAIQKQYTALTENQTARFVNTGFSGYSTINLTQGASVFSAATLRQVSTAGIFSKISNHIDQIGAAKTQSPMQWLVDFFSQWIRTIVFAVGGFVGLILFCIIALRFVGASGGARAAEGIRSPEKKSKLKESAV